MAKISTIYGDTFDPASLDFFDPLDQQKEVGDLRVRAIRLAGGPYAGHLALSAVVPPIVHTADLHHS